MNEVHFNKKGSNLNALQNVCFHRSASMTYSSLSSLKRVKNSFAFYHLDTYPPFRQRPLIVLEGKTLNMSCAAIGNPRPQVEWRREDGRTINVFGIESTYVIEFNYQLI